MSKPEIERHIVLSIIRQISWGCVLGIAVSSALAACHGQEQSARTADSSSANTSSVIVTLPRDSIALLVPVGIPAGLVNAVTAEGIKSPYAGNAAAIKQGGAIGVEMNCVGCHGYDLKGGMGPDLTDTYWRYGGSPALIYKSIYEGRPQGMPAWGKKLPPDAIWKIVAFIESQGGAFPGRLAEQGRQGNLDDSDAVADMKEARVYAGNKGRQSEK